MDNNGKSRHSVWLSDEVWQEVDAFYKLDNCPTRNEFVEKALRQYCGRLHAERSVAYLPRALQEMLEGTLGVFGDRLGKLLFKLVVEHNMTNHLLGGDVFFDMVTVGGTINVMLAAARAEGTTVIYNAAKEPHIVDLANFLNSMGARVKGAGTDVIRIRGMQHLHHCTYTVIPDQIETGTLMIAAAATRGDVTIHGCIPTHMEALTAKLLEMGVRVTENDDSIRVRPQGEQRAVNVKTQVYPGFPTDLQQPMTALLCMAHGTSTVCETIFEQRFKHLDELRRMGAHIKLVDRTVLIEGVRELYGAPVTVTDLRAGAALVVAGLMAKGVTEIYETSYIDRGYERIEEKLRALGAEIRREKI